MTDSGEEPRSYPSTWGGLIYLVVLGTAAAGLVVVATGHWRLGVKIAGLAMLVAAGARGLLHPRHAGMLEVRSKTLDVVTLSGLGLVLITLAVTIPAPPD